MTREIFGVRYETIGVVLVALWVGTAGILYFVASFWGNNTNPTLNITVSSSVNLTKQNNATLTYECFKECIDIAYKSNGFQDAKKTCSNLCEKYT